MKPGGFMNIVRNAVNRKTIHTCATNPFKVSNATSKDCPQNAAFREEKCQTKEGVNSSVEASRVAKQHTPFHDDETEMTLPAFREPGDGEETPRRPSQITCRRRIYDLTHLVEKSRTVSDGRNKPTASNARTPVSSTYTLDTFPRATVNMKRQRTPVTCTYTLDTLPCGTVQQQRSSVFHGENTTPATCVRSRRPRAESMKSRKSYSRRGSASKTHSFKHRRYMGDNVSNDKSGTSYMSALDHAFIGPDNSLVSNAELDSQIDEIITGFPRQILTSDKRFSNESSDTYSKDSRMASFLNRAYLSIDYATSRFSTEPENSLNTLPSTDATFNSECMDSRTDAYFSDLYDGTLDRGYMDVCASDSDSGCNDKTIIAFI